MISKTILLLTATAFLPGLCHTAAAQTCRVSMGMRADGAISYKEVYEFDFVDHKPEFPGGGAKMVSYINRHRQYPAEAYKRGIQGRVICSFVVNTDGSLSHLKVLRGVEKSLNAEALRIIGGMPQWQPGRLEGIPVPVRVICAVPFRQ